MCKYEYPKEKENYSARICQKVGQVRGPYCNSNEISIDRTYMYNLFISYLFSIVSGAVMQEMQSCVTINNS